MQYCEKLPSPQFADLVKCFWSLEYQKSAANGPEPLVPDGCVEIIFNLADRFRRYYQNGYTETQAVSLVAGQMYSSVLIAPSGNVSLFGIRFRPAGAFPFFRFGMCELADRIESLESVWGGEVAGIEERLSFATNFEYQIAVAESVLAERLHQQIAVDPWLIKAVDIISTQNGTKSVSKIAKDIGISERGLERRFRDYIGLTPKMYSRIVRFQRVLKTLESTVKPDISDTALLFGYYDQSHLINDFRQFAGTSPAAFLEKSHRITEMFITSE
jgi:AraC-like DNA-binding protein